MPKFLTQRVLFAAVGAVALAGIVIVGAAAAGSGGDEPATDRGTSDPAQPPPSDDDRESVAAPIDEASFSVAESSPLQYFLRVVSGQPGGCYEFEGYNVSRDGNKVVVSVTNTVPKNLAAMICTAEYRTTESNIALGSDFEPGETYTVIVNGEKVTEFVAE